MPKQLYLFYGAEDYLIGERIDQLKKRGGVVEKFDGEESPLEEIQNALQIPSLFAADKLVIIDNLDLNDEKWDQLCPVLSNLSPGITVVFTAEKPGKRSKLFKTIDKFGETMEFRGFAEWEEDQLVGWVVRQAKEKGKTIAPQAARLLVEISGRGLRQLSAEIEKLITYSSGRREISIEDIRTLASPGEISAFELLDAVSARDLKRALAAYKSLEENKAEIHGLLALLAGEFRAMLMLKATQDSAATASALEISPYFVKKAAAHVRNFSAAELKDKLRLILDIDLKLKTGWSQPTAAALLLEGLVS